jgi:hypothetical protein
MMNLNFHGENKIIFRSFFALFYHNYKIVIKTFLEKKENKYFIIQNKFF